MAIKVTDGTNTNEEKSEMIRQAMSVLKDVAGITLEAGRIVIHDLDANSRGYDGRTGYSRGRQPGRQPTRASENRSREASLVSLSRFGLDHWGRPSPASPNRTALGS